MSALCYCGSNIPFVECCQRYVSGEENAPTAEALMRSRYSAFCEGALDYLIQTQHPDWRTDDVRAKLEQSFTETQWLNLMVLSTQQGRVKDQKGVVEFVAAHRPKTLTMVMGVPKGGDPEIRQLHESSRFVRDQDERWVYVDGDQLPAYRTKRGDPCWCGSGKKTKQCHG